MRIPPTLNVENDWLFFDNLQPIYLQNQNQPDVAFVQYALQEGIDTIMADVGDGALGYRTFCTWHVWRNQLNNFVPQINCKLTDKAGRNWYVANVNLHVWGNKYQLDCELEAGLGVVSVVLPVATPTPTTTPLPTGPTPTPSASPTPTPDPTASPTPTPSPTAELLVTNGGTLPQANQGQNYNYQFTATGGTGNYTWSIISGDLP